ncbi:DUF262 domain-containing protein [Leptospira sp. 'Mane']|uniref:DUF262 domain-containing protein n=1 Tax=Leptospira sp. 'Mane' TaxID=3387407 RepID=UPI00398B372F
MKEPEIENLPEEEAYISPPVTDKNKIISYNVSNTVEILIQKIDNSEIDLKPEFQRDFVWDKKRSSFFIDSLIIGLPIPSIFLGKRKDEESFFVIDGQQRLKTIYAFYHNKFFAGKIEKKFKLFGLDGKDWDNSEYAALPENIKRKFRNAVLNTTIIENIDSDPQAISDIFHRLNTGGMPLNDQEIRNCIFSGNFNDYLMNLNYNEQWGNLLGRLSPSKRLKDIELLLRFVSLFYNINNYKEPMRNFLNNFMNSYRTNITFSKEFEIIFNKTINIIHNEIGIDAFRISKYFNRAVCDSVLVGIANNIKSNNLTNRISESYSKLLKDKAFNLYINESTTLSSNLIGRIDLSTKYFSK